MARLQSAERGAASRSNVRIPRARHIIPRADWLAKLLRVTVSRSGPRQSCDFENSATLFLKTLYEP